MFYSTKLEGIRPDRIRGYNHIFGRGWRGWRVVVEMAVVVEMVVVVAAVEDGS